MTSRRKLLTGIGSSALLATTGCIGSGGGLIGNGGSSGDGDTHTGVKNLSGQITGLTTEGVKVTLSVKDSSKVDSINIINEAGEHAGSASVATGASQVSYSFMEENIAFGGYESQPTGEYQFVAVNDQDEQVGKAVYVYNPVIELADVSTGAEAYPDEEGSLKWLVLSVTNTGTAPGVFDGMQFSYLPEKDVNNVDAEDQDLPRFIQTEGVQDGQFLRGSLDTLEEMEEEEEDIEEHVLEPGETSQFMKRGFFESMEGNTSGVESCDFERSFSIRVFSTPTVEERAVHEATVKLTGEPGAESGFGSVEYWCGSSEITAFEVTESNPEE